MYYLSHYPRSLRGWYRPGTNLDRGYGGDQDSGLYSGRVIIESIRRPGAYVVEGYPRDLMTEALTRHLTEDEVNALAVFLQYQQ